MSNLGPLSMKMVKATKEVKKAKWYYEAGLYECYKPLMPPSAEINEAWDDVESAESLVKKLQNRLVKILTAKIEVEKAKWWAKVGVIEDSYETDYSLAYPFDTRSLEARRHEAQSRAYKDYTKAINALEDLMAEPQDLDKELSDAEEARDEGVREIRHEGRW